jgi:amino acid adenylation domain-containing protein
MAIATNEGQLADGAFPLTPLQEGMLFHHLAAPDSGVDTVQMVIELNEEVDPKLLEAAWSMTVQNHPMLRTYFAWAGLPHPVQQEVESVIVPFSVSDLQGLAANDSQRQIAEYLKQDRNKGFDMRQVPLLRFQLFTIDENRHVLVWTFHHILIDGRSFSVILEEAFGRFEALRSGEPINPEPGTSYRGYVSWLSGLDTSGAAEFWRDKLKGVMHPTPLPFSSQQRETTNLRAYGEVELDLASDSTAMLNDLASASGFTLNNLFMAAWAVLLYRHCGEPDVIFGATKSTRNSGIRGAEDTVGLFLATLPIRLTVLPQQSFRELLTSVREYWMSAREHENTPLVQLKQVSDIGGDAPLFDSMVVFARSHFGNVINAGDGHGPERHFRLLEQTNHGLTVSAYGGKRLKLKLQYDARRFEDRQAVQLLNHLQIILHRIAAGLDNTVDGFGLLTSSERSQVLGEFNATGLAYPRERPLASLIESQVERSPEATAVVFGERRLMYRELNARANQLARELQKHGAGPGKLVGLYVDRSAEMLVGLLAIVKSGAGYLPLDPLLPVDRLEYMLEDSDVKLVLTDRALQGELSWFQGQFVLLDDTGWQSNSDSNLDVPVDPSSAAYVLYTSGSTGRPKGVEVPRSALTNLLFSMREWLQLSAEDRLLAVTTISFDIAGVDMWLPLLVGAQTVLATREQASDGDQLLDLVKSHKITFLQATPVTWWLLLGAGWEGDSGLQAVCTGEAMPRDLATQLFPKTGRLWNLYGPTETTIWSTGFQITSAGQPVLIGKPVHNTQCYILDATGQPVPLGATGELYIAGDGLATGYLNRPELTAEKFVANPFSSVPGARMYRTGDLARYHADGQIECLGRTDHQVKIRGYRIELGEIETLLKTLPEVDQAVVVAREDTPGDKRLVAYIVSQQGTEIDRAVLRDHLKAHLPLYMVPSDFVALDAIPINPNGKIDRNKLPKPEEFGGQQIQHTYVAPRNDLEQAVLEIWMRVLGQDRIGVKDSFFDLGGHSLLAVQVISAIRIELDIEIGLKVIFTHPTIEDLVLAIEEQEFNSMTDDFATPNG